MSLAPCAHRLPPLLHRQSRSLSSHAGAGPGAAEAVRMAPPLSWERWSLAVCLGDKTVFPAAWLCRVGPGAGTGSRGGGQQQIPERAQESTHTQRRHTRHTDSGRPAHAAHARSWRDRSTRTRSPRGRTSGSARQRRAPGWRFTKTSTAETLPWFQHTISGGFPVGPTCPPLPPRGDPLAGSERGASTRAVKTSWATRRVKHAHHKTSRRRRRSGEDLGHPADERCGGLA